MPERVLVAPDELFGDGVFETVHLRPSGPWLLTEHLDRLARSAALLEIEVPPDLPARIDAALAGGLTATAAAPFGAPLGDTPGERALRIILTRRSAHVTVSPVPPAVIAERRNGIRVRTAGVGTPPPWSLASAKTLSYASNFAARRWARRHGDDDVLWLSTERYALEAPTASLVWLAGQTLGTVPAEEAGILPGTTATHLLSLAPRAGLRAEVRMITYAELVDADAIWLASSLRGLAEVTALDGSDRERSPWTARLLGLLGFV
ncbi:MAG: aminotransferase class IV [Actinoplanes sp.]